MISNTKLTLSYEAGTLALTGPDTVDGLPASLAKSATWDARSQCFRAPAHCYRDLVLEARQQKIALNDLARDYRPTTWTLVNSITPRAHQSEALQSWDAAGRRGVVCLPTGAGKTILAMMAIAKVQRPTLVVVPTLDLLWQWAGLVEQYLGVKPGYLGGGEHDVQDITIATYDSAQMYMEHLGRKFAFLVFDECHHLPAPQYRRIALASIAPFRLGLSATVERQDGLESVLFDLVGPMVYSGNIHSMVGKDLSPYTVKTIEVPMNEQEQHDYDEQRAIYRNFVKTNHIMMASPDGWQQFIRLAGRSEEGREAMRAFRAQKQLAQGASGKLAAIWEIIEAHNFEKIIIFTHENAMAYTIGRTFFVPVLTHLTKVAERKRILAEFRAGKIQILATSRVLNEGVDVPDASVGIVVSGTSTVREHVQRLGRILRAQRGKHALLYELITQNTGEKQASQRRRQHHAYQRVH